ncbi:hypothetical protein [Rhizohabitans arisaemae]|uniref:hypothetical protein n=1 Tax=Rhizohabitans arisaemae TaxID=2720610 RepID=UPI0024B21AC0|nr:hypothetical protein [Rhizohabitans arisaemae]
MIMKGREMPVHHKPIVHLGRSMAIVLGRLVADPDREWPEADLRKEAGVTSVGNTMLRLEFHGWVSYTVRRTGPDGKAFPKARRYYKITAKGLDEATARLGGVGSSSGEGGSSR